MLRILTGVILVVLAGCDVNSNIQDLESFTDNAFKSRKPDIEPLPALTPVEVFIYQASDKADPFDQDNLRIQKVQEKIAEVGELAPDLARRREPLETFPLDSLTLVGVMQQNEAGWGVIRAPNGTVHRVAEGNHMGKNFGEIIRIEQNLIKLTELVQDSAGLWKKRITDVYLIE